MNRLMISTYIHIIADYLEGLDGLEVMFTESLGWCMCNECRNNFKENWVEAFNLITQAFRKNHPEGGNGFLELAGRVFPGTERRISADR